MGWSFGCMVRRKRGSLRRPAVRSRWDLATASLWPISPPWCNSATACPAFPTRNIQTIWANKAGGWNTDGYALYVNTYNTGDQRLLFESGDGTTGMTLSSPPNAVTPGVWHALAAAVNEPAGAAQLYVDGATVASGPTATDFANSTGLDFGRFTNAVYYFDGALDEARIARGACSSNWIRATWLNVASNSVFNSASAVNPQPPLSHVETAGGVWLTWPAASGVFILYTTASLAPPAAWAPATNSAVYANGQWQAPVFPSAQGSQFYRLQSR